MKKELIISILVVCGAIILSGCQAAQELAASLTTTTLATTTTTTTSTSSTVSNTTSTITTTSSTTTTTRLRIPENVSGFQAFAGNGQIYLAWGNPADPNFSGVKILRKTTGYPSSPTDGTVIYTGTSSSELNNGLINGTTYYYTAFSFNSSMEYSSGTTTEAIPFAIVAGITIGNNAVFYDYIDGFSYLVAKDGQYLGEVSSNKFAANSITNTFGTYGNRFSSKSILNEYGVYGSPYNLYSAYNLYTITPPVIILRTVNGNVGIAYLTKNRYLLYAIDPDLLIAYYNTK